MFRDPGRSGRCFATSRSGGLGSNQGCSRVVLSLSSAPRTRVARSRRARPSVAFSCGIACARRAHQRRRPRWRWPRATRASRTHPGWKAGFMSQATNPLRPAERRAWSARACLKPRSPTPRPLACGGFGIEQNRTQLCLVDLSHTPTGTFFREVRLISEMAWKYRPNRCFPPGLPRGKFSGPWLFSTAEARTSNSPSSNRCFLAVCDLCELCEI